MSIASTKPVFPSAQSDQSLYCQQLSSLDPWPRGFKTFFNQFNAHKYKEIKKFGLFLSSDKPRMLFFQLINVKMPTVVGILTFMSRKNFILI